MNTTELKKLAELHTQIAAVYKGAVTTDTTVPNTSAPAPVPVPTGFKLVEHVNFANMTAVPPQFKVYAVGAEWPSTGGAGYWNGNQVRVTDNELQLVARKGANGKMRGGAVMWTGSNNQAIQKYGRWEWAEKHDAGPAGQASLLWPTNDKTWPQDGEIDVKECGRERDGASTFVHLGPVVNQDRKIGPFALPQVDYTQWHNFAVEWFPDHIAMFLDGREYFRTSDKNFIPSTNPMRLTWQQEFIGITPHAGDPVETVLHIDNVRYLARV